MEEIKSPANGGEGANADAQNKGTEATPKESAGTAEITVPRRNAEYWDSAKKRRDAAQAARAEYFKSAPRKDEDGNSIDDEDAPLTHKEYQRMWEQDRQSWEEEQDKRLMSQGDETSINAFLSKNEKFRKYEKQARAFMKEHPHYPLEGIFRDLAYDDALAEGTAKKAKADEKQSRNTVGGGTSEPQKGGGYDPAKHGEFKKNLKMGRASFTPAE